MAGLSALLWFILAWWPGNGHAQSEPVLPPPVGEVAQLTGERPGLDVGIVVFDPGIPPDPSVHSKRGIFPRIREAEARYLPVLLRQTLQDSGAWGVVRVLPQAIRAVGHALYGRVGKFGYENYAFAALGLWIKSGQAKTGAHPQ